MKLKGRKAFVCVNMENFEQVIDVQAARDTVFYKRVERSFNAWPDIRDPKNFLHNEKRMKDVDKIKADLYLEFENLK